jgi:Fe-S cluster biosynthesis and repair protein YggX
MEDTPCTDQQLAAAAAKKRGRGEKLSREEKAALSRAGKVAAEARRQQVFRSVRKKEWREWSGRQDKVLNEQAVRYGVPIGAATIALPEVVRWLHDFLADHAAVLAAADDDGPDARERLTAIRCELEQLKLERERGQWMPRKDVREALTAAGRLVRQGGEALLRQYGPGAKKILDDALDSVQADVDRRFGDDQSQSPA